jgi:hypothetical protein
MTISLDHLYTHLRGKNPFANNRVDRPSSEDIDVPEIHEEEFQRILAHAEDAHNRGVGVVVWGEAGLGKSHLLSRLSRKAEENHWPFVYLHNLQPVPDQFPRYVLKCVVSVLTRGRIRDFHETPIYSLVSGMIQAALRQTPTGRSPPRDMREALRQIETAYEEQVSRLQEQMGPAASHLLDRTIFDVLLRFYLGVERARFRKMDEGIARLAVRWLSGEYLDGDEALLLGLTHQVGEDDPVSLEGNEQIKLVFVALSQLARLQDKPLILCFDQVDNLDPPLLAALSQFLLSLLNTCENLLVISCGVQATLSRCLTAKLKDSSFQVIESAAWDRMAQDQISLSLLRGDEGRAILEARLKKHLEPFTELMELQSVVKKDPLFPLGTSWLNDRLQGLIEFRPRQIINWARERWEIQQRIMSRLSVHLWLANWNQATAKVPLEAERNHPEAVDQKVEEKIRAQETERKHSPHTLPPSAENLAGLVERILGQCLDQGRAYGLTKVTRPAPSKKGLRSPFDLLIERQVGPRAATQTTGLLFLSTASPQSVAAHLRRLADDRQLPARILVVTDERQPLPHLGAKGRERWQELQKRKGLSFKHRELTFEEYVALDALQHVVGMAASGDLEVEWPRGQIRPVNEKEVIESHHRKGRYRGHAFLNRFLEEGTGNRDDQPIPASLSPESSSSSSASGIGMRQEPDSLWIGNLANQMPVNLPVKILPLHVAVVGSTGCGKTYLAKALVEEAILHDIPVLAIDSQGDLAQFLKPREPDQFSGNVRRRFDLYWQRVEPRIYTPGSAHGIRLSLNPLRLAREADLADPARRAEELQNIYDNMAGNLVALADCGGETDCQNLFLRKILDQLGRSANETQLDWAEIVRAVEEPQVVGIDDPNSLIKKSERESLARKLNGLKENILFTGGRQAVDLDELCRPQEATRVPLNVVYLNALSEEQKQSFVAALAAEIYRWMVTSRMSRNPRLLLYVDEARDYIPAGAIKPASKEPLNRLFRQARKYGVACLICTQSPRKVDFEVFGNCNTKMVGRLGSAQDIEHVTQWFANEVGKPNWIKERKDAVQSFVARWPEMLGDMDGQPFLSRELFSLHEDAWSPDQVEQEMSENPVRKAVMKRGNQTRSP